MFTRRPAGHISARRPAPSSRGSSSRAPLLPLSLLFSQAFLLARPRLLLLLPGPRLKSHQPKKEGVSAGGGGSARGGGEGHAGRGGKWQAPGLRPQLMLLVQPHPGGEMRLLLFLVYGAGGGSEVGDEMSPRLGCAVPQGSSAPLKTAGPANGWEKSPLLPPSKPLGPKRLEAGKQHGAACCLLCMQPAWVSPMSKEGRAGLLQDRLAWVPHPTHFIPLPRHLPHRATPRREQASENVTCPGRECWGRGTRVCGRLSSGVSPPEVGGPGAGKAMALALENLSIFSFYRCPATASSLP